MQKSPTITIDGFISPLKCSSDNILDFVNIKAQQLIPLVNNYYNVNIKSTIPSTLLSPNNKIICDNSYYRYKWIRHNNYDFTGYITLNDYNNTPPFDIETEVYGGELVFKNYKSTVQPGMGNLLIFPSSPNFVHYHTPIKLGKFNFIKFYFICESPFVFDYTKYSTQFTQNITL